MGSVKLSQIPTTVPDLKEISTAAVSISLLSHVHMPCIISHYDPMSSWKENTVSRIIKSAKKLPLPKLCVELIEKNIRKICVEIEIWVSYHHRKIFLSLGSVYDLFCLVSDIVWYRNSAIDYKRTALQLQSSLRLSDVQKFRLLCTYCLKEEIAEKWPALFENDAFDRLNFVEYPLIQYWNSYCRNALVKISVHNGNAMSLDSYMFQSSEVDNWHAKEYFLDRMNDEEKFQNVISMLDSERFQFQKQVLSKLNETQRYQLYVEKPARVLYHFIKYNSVGDATSAWLEIRDLIEPEQFVTVIKELCKLPCDESFVLEVWRSASNEMKFCLLSSENSQYFDKFWNYYISICDITTFKKFFDTNEDIKKIIVKKEIFIQNCIRLIKRKEVLQMETLLSFCFPNSEELVQFKHHHIHQSTWFRSHCEDLVISVENLVKDAVSLLEHLERLLNFCFCDRKEVIQFGKDLTNGSSFNNTCRRLTEHKLYIMTSCRLNRLINAFLPEAEDRYQFITESQWFSDRCKDFISTGELSRLKEMLNLFLPEPKDFFQFSVTKMYTLSFLEKPLCLVISHRYAPSPSKLLQELYDLFPCPANKFARLKIFVTRQDFFLSYCQEFIVHKNLNDLRKELQYFFDNSNQSASFRRNLIETLSFFPTCKRIVDDWDFSVSKLETLMDLITFNSTTILSSATTASINKFKVETIFSSRCTFILRELVQNNRFEEVKKFFNGFLVSKPSKKSLRLQLFEKPDQLVKKFFFEYDELTCKSWMEWWFSDEQSLRECKRDISLDTIFEEGFKKCVFQTYDESGRVSQCTLNENFEFGALGRFLGWRFDSAKQVKEYKLRWINQYRNMDTINVLVQLSEKECHISCFEKLIGFFFENDFEEIAKFKKKHGL